MFGIGKKKATPEAPSVAPEAPAAASVELQPAGFWLRVVAFIVDYALLLFLLAAMLTGAMSVGGEDLAGPAYWLWIVVSFFYWPVLESTEWRATVGKKLLGLVVGDVDGGGLNFVRSLLRNLAKIISSIPFGIGYLMAAFTARKQALHDLITKAVVLRKGPGSFVRAIGVLVVGIGLLIVGSYVTYDMMAGNLMKEWEEMIAGGVAQPPAKPAAKPPVVAKPTAPAPQAPAPAPAPEAQAPAPAPTAKPAPSPVQVAQASAPAPAPAKPAAEIKSASAPKPAAAAVPAPNPTATAPASAPQAAAAPKPSAAPKPAAAQEPAAKPASAPAPAAKPTVSPAKPEPAKVAAAPKGPESMAAKPAPTPPASTPEAPHMQTEPPVPLARPAIALPPGPRFNDVMTAVIYRDIETVAQLLSLGRWPDKRDSNGLTPLMVAAGNGDAAMVQLLLERGADPDLQAPGGATALELALERGDAPTIQLLQRKAPR